MAYPLRVLLLDPRTAEAALLANLMREVRPELECRFVDDPLKVFEAIAREATDLIVSELRIRGSDCFDLLRQLKSNAEFKSIPVAIMARQATAAELEKAKALGACFSHIKPESLADYRKVVFNLMTSWARAIATTP